MLLVGGILKKVNAKNPLNVMTNVHRTGLIGWHHQIITEEQPVQIHSSMFEAKL
jgi:hypothetical protein